MAGVSAVFAQLERELIAQRTAEALAELRARGRVFGPVPFGYDRVDAQLVENTSEQLVLSLMKEMRERGKSYAGIANRLNRDCVPSKRGGRWYSMSVRSVLKSAERMEGAELQGALA
jgi:DNA invertase Pin-like site-specific DNA recombinase